MNRPAIPARLPFWAAVGCMLVAAIVLNAAALHTAFFADDYLFLDQVRGRSLWAALQAPDPLSNFLRPLSRQVWFWCVAALTGESPYAFRVGNLAFVLASIALLAGLVRRVSGERAALVAAGVFALHYSSDVAVRWASGSQDAMAVAFALASLWLFVAGRAGWAALALLLGTLCKEIVVFTPLVALLLARREREPWVASARRAWPLAAAVGVYLAISLLVPRSRSGAVYEVLIDPVRGPLAALAHLPQVALGLEWVHGAGIHVVAPPLVPLALVLVVIALAWGAGSMPKDRSGVVSGVAWALLATAPLAAVAHLWSAYYYLFAVAGLALAAGTALARPSMLPALSAVGLLAWGSAIGREVPGFTAPRDRWSTTSHVNRQHIEHANRVCEGYLASLRRQHPTPPPGSSVFFSGLQGGVGFQRADGPLLRWAYRDSSLRGYFLGQFTRERYERGPAFFMTGEGDSLRDMPAGDDLLVRVAFGLAVSDLMQPAEQALLTHLDRSPDDRASRWWLAWVALANADTMLAMQQLARVHPGASPAPFTGRDAVLATLARGDTLLATRMAFDGAGAHPFDAGAHGLLADLLLASDAQNPNGAMFALAARVLAPDDPFAWRRWGQVQLTRDRPLEALGTLQRYLDMTGGARDDTQAHDWIRYLRGVVEGSAALSVGQ